MRGPQRQAGVKNLPLITPRFWDQSEPILIIIWPATIKNTAKLRSMPIRLALSGWDDLNKGSNEHFTK